MTRRKDTELRAAIDDVQSVLGNKRSLLDIYEKTLAQTMRIANARFGIVFTHHEERLSEPFVAVSGYENSPRSMGNDNEWVYLPDFDAHAIGDSLNRWKPNFLKGEPVFFFPPYHKIGSLLPSAMYGCKQIAFIPIVNKNTFDALIILGLMRDMTDSLLHRLWPLLAASTTVRNSLCASVVNKVQEKQEKTKTADTADLDIFHALQEYSFNSLIVTNTNGKIISVNRAARQLLEAGEESELLGAPLSNFVKESFPNELTVRINNYSPMDLVKNRFFPSRMECYTLNGRRRLLNMTFYLFVKEHEQRCMFILEDQTLLIEEQQTREIEERRFHAVADIIHNGILQTNDKWECVYVNNAWCDLAGLSVDEMRGLKWVNAIHERESERVLAELIAEVSHGRSYETTCRLSNPLGRAIWVDLNASPLISEEGVIEGLIISANDVTLHRTNEERLRRVAQYDALTGLANRSLFSERLNEALAMLSPDSPGIAVLFVDLDGFKNVNDSMGHDFGDLILKEVAERLRQCVSEHDTVARFGGDEFTILISAVGENLKIEQLAKSIIARIALPYVSNAREVFLTTSLGIAFAHETPMEASILLKQADMALYQAKHEGRNNYQFFSGSLGQKKETRLRLANKLHRALDRNEFNVAYQPLADLQTNKVVGVEALIRWYPDHQELVPASQCVSLLEETGLIKNVGRWMLEEACKTFHGWLDKNLLDKDAHLSINLSPLQFSDKELLRVLRRVFRDWDIQPENIILEITETALLGNDENILRIIKRLKKMGLKIALDDFGTGYSSLSHLKNFPIDIIKIDQSFTRDLLSDSEDAAIVHAITALGESMSKTIIVEGVDDVAKLQYLKRLGIDYYQGYLLAKPLDKYRAEAFFLEGRLENTDNMQLQQIHAGSQGKA